MKNKLILTSSVLLALCSSSLWADIVYVCQNGGAERKITISYEQDGAQVPCAVTYEKAEGVQTLWSAQAQVGYCEEKAAAFVEKQRGWGWSCDEVGTQSPEPEAASAEASEEGIDEAPAAEPSDSDAGGE